MALSHSPQTSSRRSSSQGSPSPVVAQRRDGQKRRKSRVKRNGTPLRAASPPGWRASQVCTPPRAWKNLQDATPSTNYTSCEDDERRSSVVKVFVELPPGLELPVGRTASSSEGAAGAGAGDEAAGPSGAVSVEYQKEQQQAPLSHDHDIHVIVKVLTTQKIKAHLDADGFIPITKVFRLCPDVGRMVGGRSGTFAKIVDDSAYFGPSLAVLDKARRRVRLLSLEESIRSEAGRVIKLSKPMELAGFVRSPALTFVFQEHSIDIEEGVRRVKEALNHDNSTVGVRLDFLVRQPTLSRLGSALEELFSDSNLATDIRLRTACAQGEVSLTWLCCNYGEHLGLAQSRDTCRPVLQDAERCCKALATSKRLVADATRLSVRMVASPDAHNPVVSQQSSLLVAPHVRRKRATSKPAAPKDQSVQNTPGTRPKHLLRQLLDFYFEPFSLQHNRLLLDLISTRLAIPTDTGPWVVGALNRFTCTMEELLGLGRISALMNKLDRNENVLAVLEGEELKHVRVRTDGRLELRTPVELRRFVVAPSIPRALANDVVLRLMASKERCIAATPGVVTVLSYVASGLYTGDSGATEDQELMQRRTRVKRQLLLYHTDFITVRGVDVTDGAAGTELSRTLALDGYECARSSTRGRSEVVAIFWDTSRFKKLNVKEHDADIVVTLRPLEDPTAKLRIGCLAFGIRDGVPSPIAGPLAQELRKSGPLIVCAELSSLGGAECATVAPELACLDSAALTVLGDEVASLVPAPQWHAGNDAVGNAGFLSAKTNGETSTGGGSTGLCSSKPAVATNGLNRLGRPDAILYDCLRPVTMLSGHSEGYLKTMQLAEAVNQFPALRLPLVAAFSFKGVGCIPPPQASAVNGENIANAGSKCVQREWI